MQYLFYILSIPFLYINYKIILSDLKYKKIPNKYLGYLLILIPFYYIYIFLNFSEIHYFPFFWQIFVTFIISFVLYYFWVWAAWDAKYLLVLALFIPYIWIVPFIWNIALITLAYLFWYFLWFYFYKIALNKIYRQSLWWNIKQDLNERWKVHKINKWWNTYKIIFKWWVIFLLIFVSIRLVRLYLFHSVSSHFNRFEFIKWFIEKYNIYLVFLGIWLFIAWLYLIKNFINKIKKYISEKFKINLNVVWNILLVILSIFLISFISFEYYKNPYEIKSYLFRIFTLYLALYLILKILKWAYKITFWVAESQYIDIKDLKEWDIVDKSYLVRIFWKQYILGYYEKWFNDYYKDGILFPSPKKYFTDINNPVDKKTSNELKNIYKITNKYQKEKNDKYSNIDSIKILNTFSFAPYIISWFIITFLFQDKIFKFLMHNWIEIIKHFFNYK